MLRFSKTAGKWLWFIALYSISVLAVGSLAWFFHKLILP